MHQAPRPLSAFCPNILRPLTSCLLALALLATATTALAKGKKEQSLGVQLGAYFEDGELDDNYRVSVTEQSQSFDYDNDGTFNIALNYMAHYSESIRLGGLLRYYGEYGANPLVDEDADEAPPTFVFGQLTEAIGEVEWLIPVIGAEWEMALGGQLGLALLFPDGDLQNQIDALNDQGIGVWDSPRLGYTVGARVGARYRLSKLLGFTASYGVQVSELYLYDTDEQVNTIPVRRETNLGIVRQNIVVGTEVFF